MTTKPLNEPSFAITPPAVSLPKGGGAVRGIGETLTANPATGTGRMKVPIALSPGRSGLTPALALSYDSGDGNGPFGIGWNLALPAVTRRTDRGLPQYRDEDNADIFILSGADDLVPARSADGRLSEEERDGFRIHRFRPRVEGAFARIERWTDLASGDTHWRTLSTTNVTTLYGRSAENRIADPHDSRRVYRWLICETRDDKGNAILYEYEAETSDAVDRSHPHEKNRSALGRTANRYLKRIKYGNRVSRLIEPDLSAATWLFEAVFDYDEDHYELLPAAANGDVHARASAVSGRRWPGRPDPFSQYRAGFEMRTYRRCHRVLMFHRFDELGAEPYLVRSTEFQYADLDYGAGVDIDTEVRHRGSTRFGSFMQSITQSGYVRTGAPPLDRSGSTYFTYLKKSLPPLEFEYSQAIVRDQVENVAAESLENLPVGLDESIYRWIDLDGEGLSGILTEQGDAWFYKRNLSALPNDPQAAPTARFAATELLRRLPFPIDLPGQQQIVDLAGDGQMDVVDLEPPIPGYFRRRSESEWDTFRPFESLPNLDWKDPNVRFVDLTGDGLADVLIADDEVLTWHPSRGEHGFGPAQTLHCELDEEQGPRVVFADGTQSIYLADMSGDGLTDLVRIRNGDVCFWPNLGYGRFGAKITLDDAPWFDAPDQFDQRRIRVADVNGSGTSDVIYLGRDGVRIYFNQSGNRFAAPRHLRVFPRIDDVATIAAVDLLGNGTTCLVWSSPLPGDTGAPMRYVRLMEQKPYLLTRVRNNLGVDTRVEYAPSTQFYLADKAAGHPWITRLPFPVHVVERIDTRDVISRNRFVTRYAYHHGHFDGIEREFRGFGMVEQFDTEELATLTAAGDFPNATNIDRRSHVPPVYTKTWYHAGTYFEGMGIANHYAHEYYREGDASLRLPGLAGADQRRMLLPDTNVPDTQLLADGTRRPHRLSADEAREACRALKGSVLRIEVYAHDRSDASDRPYSVSESSYAVELLQPRAGSMHGAFFVRHSETIDFHYERALYAVNGEQVADPRVTHHVTLDVDGFGNVLRSASVAYGRRFPDADLAPVDQREQQRTHVTASDYRYTNAVDTPSTYRKPMPCESRTYQLLNAVAIAPPAQSIPGITNLFSPATLNAHVDAAAARQEVPFEDWNIDEQTLPDSRRRLIEHLRTRYRSDDLTQLLPLGEVHALALPGESCKLALTPGLLAAAYGNRVTSAVLAGDGRYVHSEGDVNWWVPSGRVFYSPDRNDGAAAELAVARRHFFLPRRYRDAFHTNQVSTETIVTFDTYDLMPLQVEDALGNTSTASERVPQPGGGETIVSRIDYRVLQPTVLQDANSNRTHVVFDALGRIAAIAVMGKTAAEGDSIQTPFDADVSDVEIDAFHADPRARATVLLGSATTRFVYDEHRYRRTAALAAPEAPFSATLARETHVSDLASGTQSRIQVGFTYADGFGREIQRKVQAEPGPIAGGGPLVDPRWVGSGWVIFNNKGKPVRRYEPFFDDTHTFRFGHQVGVSPVLFYDPVERVVATLAPNHSYGKTVFDPWRQSLWDVNDSVQLDPRVDPDVRGFVEAYFDEQPATWATWQAQRLGGQLGPEEQTAAAEAAAHAATADLLYLDSLGRTFLIIASNGRDANGVEQQYLTRTIFDAENNQREQVDANGRVVARYDYDICGTRLHETSMEGGEHWVLNDVAGRPIRAWDSRGHVFRTDYDPLRRPTAHFVLGTNANASDPRTLAAELLIEQIAYGEGTANDEALNLRTRAIRQRDGAGTLASEAFDFKGNLVRGTRRIATDYRGIPDWSGAVALDAGSYTAQTQYDALNRVVTLTSPDASVIRASYGVANLLDRIDVNVRAERDAGDALVWRPFVTNVDYDAKGQRTLVQFGNGAETRYRYDPETFRLTHLYTRRGAAFAGDCENPLPPPATIAAPAEPPPGIPCGAQNLHYTYDPIGNVVHIRDDAQQTIYFRNRRVDPSNHYRYDALYRLLAAEGREHLGQVGGAPLPHSHDDLPRVGIDWAANDGGAMGRYVEEYVYDAVGNLLAMQHRGSDPAHPGWTRTYAYNEASRLDPAERSNRLSDTSLGSNSPLERYLHDANGNMIRMPHLANHPDPRAANMHWDYEDRLRQVDLGGGGTVYCTYDAAGLRTRQVWEKSPGLTEERIYLGRLEIFRRHDGAGTVTLERETLHVDDDTRRVALVETRTHGDDPAPRQLVRYQFGNHLGSACLELDDAARIVSYEEYTPYGSSSYQAVRSQTDTPKRYRYAAKERDDSSGFYYCGARYYAPWLGRWTACDPAGIAGGINLYEYVSSRPTSLVDPGGREGETPPPNNPKDVADFEARQAAFESGKKLETGEVKATRKGKELPPPKGKELEKLVGNSKNAKELRLKYATKQGIEAGQVLKENVTSRSAAAAAGAKEIPNFGEASQKLVPEVGFHKGKIISVDKNPGGDPKGARTSDLAIAKEATPPSKYEALKGQKGSAALESATDLKLGTGKVADKAGFKKATGLAAEELTPGTKGLKGPKGSAGGTTLKAAGGAMILYDAFKYAREQKIAEQGVFERAGLAVLEDENGEYTLQVEYGIIFNDYSKTYISGALEGTTVELGFFEFRSEIAKRDKKYGYIDWKGDIVPGEVPIIVVPPDPLADMI